VFSQQEVRGLHMGVDATGKVCVKFGIVMLYDKMYRELIFENRFCAREETAC